MGNYKILYVDDEEINLMLFKRLFKKDFDVSTAISAKKALEIVEEQQFDLIITDQTMPEMTGIELLKELHDRYPEIPPLRMIVSGYSMPADIEMAYKNYKLSSFIPKPWNRNHLRSIILDKLNQQKAS